MRIFICFLSDENKLQDSWIRPSKANQFLDETLFHALSLMNQLSNFDIRTLQVRFRNLLTLLFQFIMNFFGLFL